MNSATDFKLSDALSIYLLDQRANQHSPRTIDNYKRQLTPFVEWLNEQDVHYLGAVASTHVRLYILHCRERGLADTSVNTAARSLRAFFNFCVREEWLSKSPMDKMKMPKLPKKLPTAMTKENVKILIKSAENERDRAMILFLLDTGLRSSEFCSLDAGDIDVGTGRVLVRSGKGAKDRIVYIGAKTIKSLIRYYASRGVPEKYEPVWLSGKVRQRLTKYALAQILERYTKKLGFACNPHELRRTFATMCLRAGMDILTLQRLMGHSDITVLKHYLLLLDEDLESAHRKFGLIDNL